MNGTPKSPQRPKRDSEDDNDLTVSRVLRNVLIWVGILVSLVMVGMLMSNGQRQEFQLTFNEYMEVVNANRVQYATITKTQLNDFEFRGTLKESITIQRDNRTIEVKNFRTKLGVVDSQTEALWREHGIGWSYESGDSPWWVSLVQLLPWALLLVAFFFISRRMQAGGAGGGKNIFSFGRSKARLLTEANLQVNFTDVAGADEAKEELREIVEFLRDPSRFTRLGGKIPRGVLLLGPPGTGKTLLARAVAGEAGVPFFTISGAEFVEMFVGVGASRVRDLFEQAKKQSPCIVFIDEIDAVGRHRGAGVGGGHDEREQTLNQLLVEMDGFEQNSGIIIIAATNRPDVLDPALLRPGRFDRQVVVDRPDMPGRLGILRVHTRKVPIAKDVNLEVIAKGTPGMSGADLANLVNESALLAARRNSQEVTMFDFESAKDKVIMGVERKSMVMSDKEKETTAYHEIGHALAGKLVKLGDAVHKVTIIPRGRALGVTSYLPNEEMHTMSRDQLETRLVMLLAGRAAERVVFDQLNTGASNDLERATTIAKKMVCEFGMSDIIGPVRYASQHDEVFLGREISQPRDHSEETARAIDGEVRRLIVESERIAVQLMRDNLDLLHRCAKALIEHEILDSDELDALIRGEELQPIIKDVASFREKMRASSPAPSPEESKDTDTGTEGLALNPS
ncbi:MAG: ATP-dependent zinc metalloprotease FtsH [Candidatus Kapabacteria bacterium]|nr:ATP-dependent zinc metalloprotease FtsH [Candidatus Kapabacteria bacterium]